MGAELIYIILGFIITLAIGLFVGMYIQKLKTKSTESVWESKEIEVRKTESSLKEEIKEIGTGENFKEIGEKLWKNEQHIT